MKIITYDTITSLNISVKEFYGWTVEMLQNKSRSILPPKISIKPSDGVFCNVMPCMINTSAFYGGVKTVTRYPDRVPALDSNIVLMDAETGEFLALMDGNWITAMRTGSVAAHSIMLLAKPGYKKIGVMGLGNVARATVLVLLEMNPEREFCFKLLRYKGQELSFVERFKKYGNFKYEFVDDTYSLVKGSDVVISGVTYAPNDFCKDEAFDEGVLVVPIHTLGFTNCDLFFDKIYGDDYGHVCNFRNFNKFKSFAEVADVISGKAPGRENDRERILAYNVGISLHDINFAAHIYEKLRASDNVPDISTNTPKEKYWI